MNIKKLSLKKETLRPLESGEFDQVAAGMISGAKISCMDCASLPPACTWWAGCVAGATESCGG
ncbi:MAG TPA: hypothetical protein VFT46_00285 [Holophagaceae bacterium]|nr:hypothetical protein [Holophagaceae bacterium]